MSPEAQWNAPPLPCTLCAAVQASASVLGKGFVEWCDFHWCNLCTNHDTDRLIMGKGKLVPACYVFL